MDSWTLRIYFICIIACVSLCGFTRTSAAQPPSEGTIVAVGDSLTAGLGVSDKQAYPALLEERLRADGFNWKVVNAGISGETSSGTLSRLAWVMKLKPDIVILEIGANDGLRGVDTQLTRKNIDEIISTLKRHKVTVVLAGMQMVKNLGPRYTKDFGDMYPSLAKKHGLILIPFFLQGVAGDPSLNQADGIHPTADGYKIIAGTIYPFARTAIEKQRKH